MKKINLIKLLSLVLIVSSMAFLTSCSNDDDNNTIIEQVLQDDLTQADKDGLLFMLEEEKLARDTYQYLYSVWNMNTFSNIKNSEQTHMNAVSDLLTLYNVTYNILPEGEFANQDLQAYYNLFVIEGQTNLINALKIGATIEDLDIVDLENYMDTTANASIISVHEKLQCGSRNHLRSYVSQIILNGDTYTPQFLLEEEYNLILNDTHENCN